ncbi:MAG: chromosome segregation protein ScpA [Acidobacteria bacterium]|nr:MAG: chromosome segregation protein ScpA [Acidobacteriota bacterium]
MDEQYKIHLPVYDGPLDLLLDLIRKQEVDIYDIPIARITQQYLDYLRMMQELDINLAGEFLLMAATLIYIKSKMLLPADPLQVDGGPEDPRLELVQRLLEHEKFKNAAQMLHQKELVESSTWTRGGMKDFAVSGESEMKVTLFDLVANFQKMLDRAKAKTLLEIERDEMTVGQVIAKLRFLFEQSSGIISLNEIFSAYRSKPSLIVAFLAILEMVYFHAIVLTQRQIFGEIVARRHENFESVMTNLDQWIGESLLLKTSI